MTPRIVWLVVLLGCTGGCSSPADDTTGGAGSAGKTTSGGTTGDGGNATGGSATGGSTTGGNAAGGSGGGSAGGGGGSSGPLTVRKLAMLAVGNQWNYAVTGDGFDCPTGSKFTKVESQETLEGHAAFQVRDFCSPDELTAFSYDADTLLQQFAPTEWLKVMTSPIQDGASWTFAPGTTITWHTVPSITVPAGTFTNCVKRTVSDSPNLEATFCPGVGQVKRVNDGYTAVLDSYDVH